MDNMIIHIAGASGAGKTTLGLKLKKKYKNKIIVKDLDDLRDDFKKYYLNKNTSIEVFKKNFKKNYQNFLDDYIDSHSHKPLIITGINTYINDEQFAYRGALWKVKYKLNTRADYKYCIDISTDEVLKQRWYREYDMFVKYTCEDLKKSKDKLYNMVVENENNAKKNVVPDMLWLLSRKFHKNQIKNWNRFYKEEGYDFLERDEIFKEITKLLKN